MNKTIVVVGDLILDRYIYGRVKRLNPESPTPLLSCEREEWKLWGAANVAANIVSLGGQVSLAFGIGNDSWSDRARELMNESNIAFIGPSAMVQTIIKERYIELTYKQQLLRTDWDSLQALDEQEMNELIKSITAANPSIIVISDYLKWLIDTRLIQACKLLAAHLLIDSKTQDLSLYSGCYLFKPNFKEFCGLLGRTLENTDTNIELYGPELANSLNSNLLITRSEKGASLIELSGKISHIRAEALDVFDVTGAGDTFLAGVAVGLAEGMSLYESTVLGNRASSVTVSHVGTVAVRRSDIS